MCPFTWMALERCQRRGAHGGFTMVELIMVVVMLSVLSVVAIPSFSSVGGIKSSAFSDQMRAAMRYAQKTAVSHHRLVCATFSTSSVTLSIATPFPAAACSINLTPPAGGAAFASSTSATVSPTSTLYFQPSGTVTSDAVGTTVISSVLAISNAGAITIQGDTGYVN